MRANLTSEQHVTRTLHLHAFDGHRYTNFNDKIQHVYAVLGCSNIVLFQGIDSVNLEQVLPRIYKRVRGRFVEVAVKCRHQDMQHVKFPVIQCHGWPRH